MRVLYFTFTFTCVRITVSVRVTVSVDTTFRATVTVRASVAWSSPDPTATPVRSPINTRPATRRVSLVLHEADRI